MKVSLIITSYNRAHLLRWSLLSISKYTYPCELELIVVNDGIEDETKSVCESFKNKLNIKYIFTGQRNSNGPKWRVPSIAINIGLKESTGEYIIISCAEMYLGSNVIDSMCRMITPTTRLTVRNGKDDIKGEFLNSLTATNGTMNVAILNKLIPLNTNQPFFMMIPRKVLMDMNGWDEDFESGEAWDDNDIIDRLNLSGNTLGYVDGILVHLFHPRVTTTLNTDKCNYNKNLYLSRKGKIIRNENKEWGTIK